jgi:hypothetical protein
MGNLHTICGCAVRNEGTFRLAAVKLATSIFVGISFFLGAIFLHSHLFAQNASSAHRSAGLKASVPWVGCPSDGQLGSREAPGWESNGESEVVANSPEIARRLAYYKAYDGPGILAPRGWHCFGTYGSNGSNLYVTPEPIDGKVLFSDHWKGFTGAAIQISEMLTDTSGRFSAARIIALVFPAHIAYAEAVISEGLEPASSFRKGPYPSDKLKYLSKEAVEYETPANHDGLGTHTRLRKNHNPIKGVAILTEESLIHAALRLPPDATDLGPIIIRQIERDMRQAVN